MVDNDREGPGRLRWGLILSASVAAVVGVAFLALLPDLFDLARGYMAILLPSWVRTALLCAFLLAVAILFQVQPGRGWVGTAADVWWRRIDGESLRLLAGPLTVVAGVAVVCELATWVPHYLTWPWWVDSDHFSLSAHAWQSGIIPYRDLPDFNFPGPIYVMWVLGRLFGWGRTLPLQAWDVGWLLALGAALAWWSRSLFRTALPGLTAYLAVLAYYLGLDCSQVSQRDWSAPLYIVLALIALQARPGPTTRIVAALAFATALAYRPYAVLFLPALVSGVEEGSRASDETLRRALAPLARWAAVAALCAILAFSPLIVAGVADDFLHGLAHLRPGGAYNRLTPSRFVALLSESLNTRRSAVALAGVLAIAVIGPAGFRRSARTWCLALLAALVYRPLSPISHDYLIHPLKLLLAVTPGFIAGVLLSITRLAPPVRLLALVVILFLFVPGVPGFCSVDRSLEAVAALARGEAPSRPPLGTRLLPRLSNASGEYTWNDYVEMLDYLRTRTGNGTRVGTVLRRFPYPPVNAPSGRLPVFPNASGIFWLRWVKPDDEGWFCRRLEEADDAVVVWSPDEQPDHPLLQLDALIATIRRCYRPESKFGRIEVWRRDRSLSVR